MTSSAKPRRRRKASTSASVRSRALSALRAAFRAREWSFMPRTAMRSGGWQGSRTGTVLCTAQADDAARRRCSPPRFSGGLRLLVDHNAVLIDRHLNRIRNRNGSACIRRDTHDVVDLGFEFVRDLRVLAQEALGVVASLPQPRVAVGEERPGLRDQVVLERQVEDAALRRDALAVLDVELGLAERRRHLVLHDLDADTVADRLGALLQGLDATDVQTLRRVELERATTRLRLRRAEHDA